MTKRQMLLAMWCGINLICLAENSCLGVVDDAEIASVEGESATLPVQETVGFFSGYRPVQIRFDQKWGNVVPNAMNVDSLTVTQNGVLLERDKDYIVDPVYGTVALLPETSADKQQPVSLSYQHSLKRIDSVVKSPDGKKYMKKGVSALASPEPPGLSNGETRIENIFVDSHEKGVAAEHFPVTDEPIVTDTSIGKIPRMLAKIKNGKPVKIVFWGDSVTVGGNASSEALRFTSVTQTLLNQKFPKADISCDVIAVSGSGSVHWLFPEISRHPREQDQCDFNRIVNARPDLVVIEFVNDDYLSGDLFSKQYDRILEEMQTLGAEVIFVAPHLTWPGKLGISNLRAADPRPYTALLKKFAQQHGCALADASGRWSQTWKEGIPYLTLLKNGVNHPDDRGHALVAEEIVHCFDE